MTAQLQETAIHVQGLEKSYKQVHVLRGVDFDIARGTVFALLGSNGAGRSSRTNSVTSAEVFDDHEQWLKLATRYARTSSRLGRGAIGHVRDPSRA